MELLEAVYLCRRTHDCLYTNKILAIIPTRSETLKNFIVVEWTNINLLQLYAENGG
jgi:hypothetical protein